MAGTKLGVCLIALLAAAPALAQTTPPSPGDATAIPEKQGTTPIQGGRSDSLSSKLSKSGGVIAPQNDVDPGIHAATPDPHPNSTPVIPPSATGGDSAK